MSCLKTSEMQAAVLTPYLKSSPVALRHSALSYVYATLVILLLRSFRAPLKPVKAGSPCVIPCSPIAGGPIHTPPATNQRRQSDG